MPVPGSCPLGLSHTGLRGLLGDLLGLRPRLILSVQRKQSLKTSSSLFFSWMLHGSTKVVVRAVALLSAKTKEKVANSLKKCFRESNILETNKQQHQPHSSLPESAGAGGCSLFLGRLDQGLVGNAESTHVNRLKGKATFVPEVGRCCNV